jgi:hypothetical protein
MPSATARRVSTTAALLVLAAGLGACGGDDAGTSVEGSGSATTTAATGGHDGHAGSGHGGSDTTATGGDAHAMTRLGETTAGDRKVELDVSAPVTFAVSEGERFVRHAPRKGENAHVMLVLTDAQSGDRLPDASITLRIVDAAGKVVASGPQYPMTGLGMGIHYGDNVAIPKAGKYVAQLVIGPPRIGRHSDVVDRWNETVRASIPFTWKGSAR